MRLGFDGEHATVAADANACMPQSNFVTDENSALISSSPSVFQNSEQLEPRPPCHLRRVVSVRDAIQTANLATRRTPYYHSLFEERSFYAQYSAKVIAFPVSDAYTDRGGAVTKDLVDKRLLEWQGKAQI